MTMGMPDPDFYERMTEKEKREYHRGGYCALAFIFLFPILVTLLIGMLCIVFSE